MTRVFLALFFVLVGLALSHPSRAVAACSGVPNTFSNGTTADANQVNSNFSSLVSCAQNVDNTQIGTAGIFASQIVPTSLAQATFASAFGYTFPNGIASNAAAVVGTPTGYNGQVVVAQATAAPTAQPGNVAINGSYFTTQGTSPISIGRVVSGDFSLFVLPNATVAVPPGASQPITFNNAANTQNNLIVNDAGGVESRASGTTVPTYVAPVYTVTGGAVPSSYHIVVGSNSCVFSSSTSCSFTPTLSGAAVFTSAASYQCLDSFQGSNVGNWSIGGYGGGGFVYTSGTQFTGYYGYGVSVTNTITVNWVCFGN